MKRPRLTTTRRTADVMRVPSCAAIAVLVFGINIICPCLGVTYIGCFLAADLEKVTPYTSAGSISNEWTCNKVCESLNFPLSYVSTAGDCRCSSMIPSYLEMQYDNLCEATVMTDTRDEPVRLQYAHSDPAQQCSLAPLPFSNYYWSQTDFRSTGMIVDGSSPPMFVDLKVDPSLGVITFNSLDSWSYGMYSMQTFGKSPGTGASLSFYVTSDTYIPQRSAWDEVDMVITSLPEGSPWAPDDPIQGIWVNTWKNGQNFSAKAVPWNTTFSQPSNANGTYNQDAFRTFSFNWQRNRITWYVDGVPIYNLTDSRSIPTQPSSVVFAFWVSDDFNCQRFGGCASANSVFQTTIRDVRRIVCGPAEQIAALRARSGVKAALPYPSPPQPPNPPSPVTPPSSPPTQPPVPDSTAGPVTDPTPPDETPPEGTPQPLEGAPPAPQETESDTTPPANKTSTFTSGQNSSSTQQPMSKSSNAVQPASGSNTSVVLSSMLVVVMVFVAVSLT